MYLRFDNGLFSFLFAGLLSPSNSLDKFKSVFKISIKTFNYICSLVKDHMMAKSTNFYFIDGKTMTLNDQVALALRRLSSGESLIAVGDSFGTNHSTVSQVTWRFVEALEESGLHHLKWPTDQEMARIKSNFENIQGLPNCCGAIATTHITMLLASSNRVNDTWRDRNGNHSMILQVNRGYDTIHYLYPFRNKLTKSLSVGQILNIAMRLRIRIRRIVYGFG